MHHTHVFEVALLLVSHVLVIVLSLIILLLAEILSQFVLQLVVLLKQCLPLCKCHLEQVGGDFMIRQTKCNVSEMP